MSFFIFIAMAFAATLGFYSGYQVGRESAAMEQFTTPPGHILSMMPGLKLEVRIDEKQPADVQAERE